MKPCGAVYVKVSSAPNLQPWLADAHLRLADLHMRLRSAAFCTRGLVWPVHALLPHAACCPRAPVWPGDSPVPALPFYTDAPVPLLLLYVGGHNIRSDCDCSPSSCANSTTTITRHHSFVISFSNIADDVFITNTVQLNTSLN